MSKISARIDVIIKPFGSTIWEVQKTYELKAPVIQIGRARQCLIKILMADSLASRIHATMFKYDENDDYMIQDGQPGIGSIANPDPNPIPSSLGTKVNNQYLTYTIRRTRERIESRIAKGIKEPIVANKLLLKDRDEILIVPEMVKLAYCRGTRKLIEDFDSTYIPSESL